MAKKTEMMYIPLLETLQKQLNNAAIFHELICITLPSTLSKI